MRLPSRGQLAAAGAVLAMTAGVAACSSNSNPPGSSSGGSSSGGGASSSSAKGTINAGGSTFQLNFQQAAIQEFEQSNPGIKVNYAGVGSGTGRSNFYKNSVLFAGSDSPIPSKEASEVPKGKKVLYFPVQMGPIAMAYNLKGVKGLKLDATTLADIFQGNIKKWNDPEIAKLNPGAKLPSTPITLAVRSDSSGTTANFSQYLVDAAKNWKLGTSGTISFPSTAHAGNGGSGVAQIVKNTPGAIGYVDFSTATASGLSAASIKSKDGSFLAPSTKGATAAGTKVTPKSDLTFSTVDEPGAASYPLTYQSWDLVYAKQPNANDAAILKTYLGYLLGSGQSLLSQINLAPLPSSIDAKAKAQLSQISG
ncbi:MAG: phosphate ABC transporter substrate-binding protein PstS [Streptosporangiales bacterium]|nr:phosphate ABC transporter substrate-binding protein PstS [Streptosporangiales bacterium]